MLKAAFAASISCASLVTGESRAADSSPRLHANVNVGVVALPRPLAVEAQAIREKGDGPWYGHFAVGASVDYLPPGIARFGEKTTLSWLQVGLEGKLFVWRFAFVGARAGYQFSRTDSEKFGSEVDYVTTSLFVTPKVGALHVFPSGLTLGADLGATVPFASDYVRHSDGTTDANARKASRTFGEFVMPSVALRAGWTW